MRRIHTITISAFLLAGLGGVALAATPTSVTVSPADQLVENTAGSETVQYKATGTFTDGAGTFDAIISEGSITTFAEPQSTASGAAGTNSGRHLVLGDLDGDGDDDAVFAGANFFIQMSNGDGTFGAVNNLGITANGGYVTLADVDGDTDLDLVLGKQNVTNATVYILKNNGSGSFTQTSTFNACYKSTIAEDLDSDGDQDLAFLCFNNGRIDARYNDGTGTFGTAITLFSTGAYPLNLEAGDFNDDGDPDLAYSQWEADPKVRLKTPTGYGAAISLPNGITAKPNGIRVADMTGDGIPDVVGVGSGVTSQTVVWKSNGSAGTFTRTYRVTGNQYRGAILIADLDGSTSPEVVHHSGQNGQLVRIHSGNTDGTLSDVQEYVYSPPSSYAAAGDVNGDGRTDLVVYDSGSLVTRLTGFAPDAATVWSSSDTGIAAIDSAALATIVNGASGTTTITATSNTASGNTSLSTSAVPTAYGDTLSVQEDSVLQITLSANDPDGDPLDYIVNVAPDYGTLDPGAPGTAQVRNYTPTVELEQGASLGTSLTFHVEDGYFSSNSATVNITINGVNDPPAITGIGTPTFPEGSNGGITTSATDPDSLTLSYFADCDNNGTYTDGIPDLGVPVGTDGTPLCSFADNGVYTVGIQVSDGSLTDEGSTTVTITNVAPTVDSVTWPGGLITATTTSLSANVSDPGTGDVVKAYVDWGDGTTPLPYGTVSGGVATVGHTYAVGVYTQSVYAQDDDGGTSATTARDGYSVVYDPALKGLVANATLASAAGSLDTDPDNTGQTEETMTGTGTLLLSAMGDTGSSQINSPNGNVRFELEYGATGTGRMLVFESTSALGHVVFPASTDSYAKLKATTGTCTDADLFGSSTPVDCAIVVDGVDYPSGTDTVRVEITRLVTGPDVLIYSSNRGESGKPTGTISGGDILVYKP